MMHYRVGEKHGLPHDPVKALIAPRPIGWISTVNAAGVPNLAPYSFFNIVADHPQMLMFSSAGRKGSVKNVEETGEFVCSIATWGQREALNDTSFPLPHGESEFAYAGLEQAPSLVVRPPRVASAPAAIECVYVKTVEIAARGAEPHFFMIIGEVVAVHIDDAYLEGGLVRTSNMKIITRAGYHDYYVADHSFSMKRPETRAVEQTAE